MKKINSLSLLFFAATATLLSASCKKNANDGKAEVHALVYHGSTPIVGTTTLYVKFDAKTQPANPSSDYDLKLFGEVDDNHVHVEDLRPGEYYLYAMAYDSLAKTAVKGGVGVSIKWSQRKEMVDVKLMVE